MAEERVQRRLAAILAADVVGYSRVIGMVERLSLVAFADGGRMVHLKAVL